MSRPSSVSWEHHHQGLQRAQDTVVQSQSWRSVRVPPLRIGGIALLKDFFGKPTRVVIVGYGQAPRAYKVRLPSGIVTERNWMFLFPLPRHNVKPSFTNASLQPGLLPQQAKTPIPRTDQLPRTLVDDSSPRLVATGSPSPLTCVTTMTPDVTSAPSRPKPGLPMGKVTIPGLHTGLPALPPAQMPPQPLPQVLLPARSPRTATPPPPQMLQRPSLQVLMLAGGAVPDPVPGAVPVNVEKRRVKLTPQMQASAAQDFLRPDAIYQHRLDPPLLTPRSLMPDRLHRLPPSPTTPRSTMTTSPPPTRPSSRSSITSSPP